MILKLHKQHHGWEMAWCIFVLALVSGCSTFNSATDKTPCRILAVGDSITVGYTDNPSWRVPFEFGYRSALLKQFQHAGVSIQFVGGSVEPWNGLWKVPTNLPSADLRRLNQDHHEGYGGKGTAFVAQHIGEWTRENQPDFVLLMIGINDIAAGSMNVPAATRKNLQLILQTVMEARSATRVIIAQVTPYTRPTPAIPKLNQFIREILVPGFVARGAHVSTVDQFANFVSSPDGTAGDASLYSNGYNHPNAKGYERMAQTWFNEIQRQRSQASQKTAER